ncbi:hypothetical protein DFH06DRAFT_1146166 [Mycena polygramma]|nr:hypothetical protein DFH06DRAFT_1146166 [Mycena polygramma]
MYIQEINYTKRFSSCIGIIPAEKKKSAGAKGLQGKQNILLENFPWSETSPEEKGTFVEQKASRKKRGPPEKEAGVMKEEEERKNGDRKRKGLEAGCERESVNGTTTACYTHGHSHVNPAALLWLRTACASLALCEFVPTASAHPAHSSDSMTELCGAPAPTLRIAGDCELRARIVAAGCGTERGEILTHLICAYRSWAATLSAYSGRALGEISQQRASRSAMYLFFTALSWFASPPSSQAGVFCDPIALLFTTSGSLRSSGHGRELVSKR